jgi:C1A family cysteine protease
VGVVEYFERRGYGRHVDGSRLFVYKATRNLMGVVGDTGAWLRNTMGALCLLGVPPEKYWPYTTRKQPGPAGERTFTIFIILTHIRRPSPLYFEPIRRFLITKNIATVKR